MQRRAQRAATAPAVMQRSAQRAATASSVMRRRICSACTHPDRIRRRACGCVPLTSCEARVYGAAARAAHPALEARAIWERNVLHLQARLAALRAPDHRARLASEDLPRCDPAVDLGRVAVVRTDDASVDPDAVRDGDERVEPVVGLARSADRRLAVRQAGAGDLLCAELLGERPLGIDPLRDRSGFALPEDEALVGAVLPLPAILERSAAQGALVDACRLVPVVHDSPTIARPRSKVDWCERERQFGRAAIRLRASTL